MVWSAPRSLGILQAGWGYMSCSMASNDREAGEGPALISPGGCSAKGPMAAESLTLSAQWMWGVVAEVRTTGGEGKEVYM